MSNEIQVLRISVTEFRSSGVFSLKSAITPQLFHSITHCLRT
jgi:hypothetical protein